MRRILSAIGMALLFSAAQPAAAATYQFTQDGYSEGATLSGFFTAEDSDTDGQISSFWGEVTNFKATFSGNSTVAGFSLDFDDLYGVVYDLDGTIGDGTSGDIEGLAAVNFASFYGVAVGPGLLDVCDGVQLCGLVTDGVNFDGSSSIIKVGAVPEPATWAMMILGFLGVGLALRRRERPIPALAVARVR